MANIFFSKIFSFGKHMKPTDNAIPVSDEYFWLDNHSEYGRGFRLSHAYVDDGPGYGAMPDITTHMELAPSIIQTVHNQYSWLVILDECISEFGSARKNLIEEFADCTGFSDVCWWITVNDPAQWLEDMQKTIQRLFDTLQQKQMKTDQ